ncbi:MAG: class I SAM-dependent methyltransferase [Candidatus Omnitrophica bacterium]|nr:class I SAM-dependent methyltransferase [Candidatus Omnitrophota bacterium]MBU2265960.1 class I SAM-dependent methyltransferase [Candidatus Omnitrophota bacterium]
MVKVAKSLEQCPFCSHKDVRLYNKTLFIWRCLSCGLLFRKISESEFVKLYKDAWSDSGKHIDEIGVTTLDLARSYLQKIAESLGLESFSGLKILDFGTGRGEMLTALSESGADAYGIDPFSYNYLDGRNFKVFRGIEKIPEEVSFDGIIANDVIEHLFSPKDRIKDLYKLLKNGGWLYIATPNNSSLNARVFMSGWREFYNPGHIWFFNSVCLERIFSELGIAKYKRLHWFIQYDRNPLRKLIHYLLRFSELDGVLRYILRK